MKLLVIGSGGREHAIAWKLSQEPIINEIFVAPGNAGTAAIAHNISISATDIPALLVFARQNRIDLAVVGPEMPLAAGIVDEFQASGLRIFGATRNAARIEASKVFAKELMERHNIPSAKSRSFSSFQAASDYVKQQHPPIVIKADGLAAGKGVTIAESVSDALAALKAGMLDKVFGAAGSQVVVEEYLTGREMSFFAFSDGEALAPTVPACDYKRVFDGNLGPNTGGMGSYSPPEFYNTELGRQVMETIMAPTIRAMRAEGYPYTGVLYGGLMITKEGPKIIEFNARFGDPETQVVLPRLGSNLSEVMQAVVDHNLAGVDINWRKEACVGVVLASGGYPGNFNTGFPVSGLNDVEKDVMVFHAGTKLEGGAVVTNGGRVLTVVALGPTLADARLKVYNNVSRITFKGMHYRKDIAMVT